MIYLVETCTLSRERERETERQKEALYAASKDAGLEVSCNNTKYVFKPREENTEQNHSIKCGNK
jgi:hypothetical protein